MTSSHTDVLTALTMPIGARLLVGHVSEADRHNPQGPIPAREHREGDLFADARCQRCRVRSVMGRLGEDVLTLVVHRGGCPELAAIRALLAP
jgi:hypothetical protein